MRLRYKSEGEVHKDFHGLTCATLHYLVDNYGIESLREILTNTAQKVYKTIHEALRRGDCAELEEYFNYGFDEITFRMYQILYKKDPERRAGRQ